MLDKSLKDYFKNKDVHFINKNFKNLKAIHKNPWIFEVDNLLTYKECDILINKSKNTMTHSRCKTGLNKEQRKSYSTRFHYDEVKEIQNKFQNLLNLPLDNFEALKIQKYNKNGFFKLHTDGFNNNFNISGKSLFPCVEGLYTNRIVTLLVYLNTVNSGGETIFPNLNLCIKPIKGKAIIFMPSYLPTCEILNNRGKVIKELIHMSSIVNEKKYICTQWGWSCSYDIYKDPHNGLPK